MVELFLQVCFVLFSLSLFPITFSPLIVFSGVASHMQYACKIYASRGQLVC